MSLTSAYPGTAPSPSPAVGRISFGLPGRDTVEYASALLNLIAWVVGFAWLAWLSLRVGPSKALGRLARNRVG